MEKGLEETKKNYMEYLKPKTKEELLGTIRWVSDDEYITYKDDYGKYYNVERVSLKDGKEERKEFYFNHGYGANIVGQYEISDSLIIFETEMSTDDYGRYKATFYEYYLTKEDKFLDFNGIDNSLSSIINLKDNKSDIDKFILHLSSCGFSRKVLEDNTVDFFIELPSFNLMPNVYSSLRNKVLEVSNIDDIVRIIDEDINYEQIINSNLSEMNFSKEHSEAEVLLLKKLKNN